MKKVLIGLVAAALALLALVVCPWVARDGGAGESDTDAVAVAEEDSAASGAAARPARHVRRAADAETGGEGEADDAASAEGEEPEEKTEEEKAEEAADAAVDAFDALTDKWEDAVEGREVTMADVDGFGAAFRKLPVERREECVQRALNLIPDENVMLLAGVLMDKTVDKEIVEAVFNDILNRDEDVKKPILLEIYKDKTHPCWADVAWILDATGELPK